MMTMILSLNSKFNAYLIEKTAWISTRNFYYIKNLYCNNIYANNPVKVTLAQYFTISFSATLIYVAAIVLTLFRQVNPYSGMVFVLGVALIEGTLLSVAMKTVNALKERSDTGDLFYDI